MRSRRLEADVPTAERTLPAIDGACDCWSTLNSLGGAGGTRYAAFRWRRFPDLEGISMGALSCDRESWSALKTLGVGGGMRKSALLSRRFPSSIRIAGCVPLSGDEEGASEMTLGEGGGDK